MSTEVINKKVLKISDVSTFLQRFLRNLEYEFIDRLADFLGKSMLISEILTF